MLRFRERLENGGNNNYNCYRINHNTFYLLSLFQGQSPRTTSRAGLGHMGPHSYSSVCTQADVLCEEESVSADPTTEPETQQHQTPLTNVSV